MLSSSDCVLNRMLSEMAGLAKIENAMNTDMINTVTLGRFVI